MAFKQKAIGQGPTNDRNKKKNVFFIDVGTAVQELSPSFSRGIINPVVLNVAR